MKSRVMKTRVMKTKVIDKSRYASRALAISFVLVASLFLTACSTTQSISSAILAYEVQAKNIQLGQSKQAVLAALSPTQANLAPRFTKPHEEYIEDDKLKEIYFFRSRSFPDGIVTDDEFTPYVFEEGKLVAIGWTAIGGPKTQAQRRETDTHFYHHGRVFFY